jgi:hypothetical protein
MPVVAESGDPTLSGSGASLDIRESDIEDEMTMDDPCRGCLDPLGQTAHTRVGDCKLNPATLPCKRCSGKKKLAHTRVGACRFAPRDCCPDSEGDTNRCQGCDDPSHNHKHTRGPGCVYRPRDGPCRRCDGNRNAAHSRLGQCRLAPREDVGPATPMLSSIGEDDSLEDIPPPATSSARGRCGMLTWACPRRYGQTVADRRVLNVLKPDDLTREQVCDLAVQFIPAVRKVCVVREPHKRLLPSGDGPEYHKHAIFEAERVFAHKNLESKFRAHGMVAYFTFQGEPFCNLLAYVAQERAHKVVSDLDPSPCCYGFAAEEIPAILATMPPVVLKKRTRLTFVELTDICVQHDLTDGVAAMRHAKKLRAEGDTLLYNHLGGLGKKVGETVELVWTMWRADSASSLPRYFHETAPYPLSTFVIPPSVQQWIASDMGRRSLVLSGASNCGKTAFAKAALGRPFWFLPTLDAANSVRILPGHGIVFDEMDLHGLNVDTAKALLDVENDREVVCRFTNGFLPAGVPRVFTTNAGSPQVFLPPPRNDADWEALMRRVTFLRVSERLF